MPNGIDLTKFKAKSKLKDRYAKQLQRLRTSGVDTGCIEKTVNETVANLATVKTSSLVIYGEPQSGKTEMMICLTGKLLDKGHSTIVHLMNDSVDLLTQNLRRFRSAGLAPAPRSLPELLQSSDGPNPQELIVFCKKNLESHLHQASLKQDQIDTVMTTRDQLLRFVAQESGRRTCATAGVRHGCGRIRRFAGSPR
jgi:hypothetical protein